MVEAQQSINEVGFRISQPLLQQIYDWEYSIDEKVFKEQLETGSYKGQYRVNEAMRPIIKEIYEKEGKILPYYGAGGSSGACVYSFHCNSSSCEMVIENTLTEDELQLNLSITEIDQDPKKEREQRLKFSIAITNFDLPEGWSGVPKNTLVCKIAGREYDNLAKWANWEPNQAFTGRYIYSFGQVSMGATGLTVKVKDTVTNEQVDVTDYENW